MTVPENRSEVRRFRPMVAPRGTSSWLPPGARGVRLSDTPAISVVLASSAPRPVLDTCLAQLRSQCREHGAELIVARACDETELENLQTANTDIRFVRLAVGTPLAHLRATGAATADGDIVALVDDGQRPPHDLVAHLVSGPRNRAALRSNPH